MDALSTKFNPIKGLCASAASLILVGMNPAAQNPDDIHRLGHFLGLGENWGYVDVSVDKVVEQALARWALLRQLRELADGDPSA